MSFRAGASNTGNSTVPTVTVPAGCAAGDVLLIHMTENNTTAWTSDPAGLASIDADTTTNANYPNRLYRGVVGSGGITAGGTITWGTLSAIRGWTLTLSAWTGINTTTPLAQSIGKAGAVVSTMVMPTVTTTATDFLVEIGSGKSNGTAITAWTPPSGWTVRTSNTAPSTFGGSSFHADRNAGSAAAGSWGGETYVADQAFNIALRYLVPLALASGNAAPTANAGADQTVPSFNITTGAATVVTFSGSGSTDSDGTIASYSWSVPGLSLSSTTVANPTATVTPSLSDQTFTATLTVTDNLGATDTDTMTLVVRAAEQAWLNSAGTWRPARVVTL